MSGRFLVQSNELKSSLAKEVLQEPAQQSSSVAHGSIMPSKNSEDFTVQQIVARSGDPGDEHGSVDPWISGEMEDVEAKWLEQRLVKRKGSARDHWNVNGDDSQAFGSQHSRALGSASSHLSHTCLSTLSADRPMFDFSGPIVASPSCEASGVQSVDLDMPLHFVENEAVVSFSPLPLISSARMVRASSNKVTPASKINLGHGLGCICTLAHLACFGILGVLIRYGLGLLFEDVLRVTHEGTALFRDLPANMMGSFFMGWVGVVFKKDIAFFSEPLAVGLSTGLMGSITTYAGWNQKMVSLVTTRDIATSIVGLLIGMGLAQLSLKAGIVTANCLKKRVTHFRQRVGPDNHDRRVLSLVVFLMGTTALWVAALFILIYGGNSQSLQILWLACMVAPPGVWLRWHLARFNGRGVRKKMKWLPVGTLAANLVAASLEAVLALVELVVPNSRAHVASECLQLGFLGCMSTVSTLVVEVNSMIEGSLECQAYLYILMTLVTGLVLGILLYSCPSWTKGYFHW